MRVSRSGGSVLLLVEDDFAGEAGDIELILLTKIDSVAMIDGV
jgi:hypothetical protein